MSTHQIANVCVVGAGFMGWQISLHCAYRGFPTVVVRRSEASRDRAMAAQAATLDGWVDSDHLTPEQAQEIASRLAFTQNLSRACRDADLVIEAIGEQIEPKRELFARLDALSPPSCILTTTSSSIRASLIEDATARPDRVANLHFYHYPWGRNMLDLMGGTQTSPETMEALASFTRDLGIVPLIARRESTGFVHNRVWRAVKREVLHLVDDGVATFQDVDRAWMISYNQPMGPFAKMDLIGLDVIRDIENVYYGESGEERDAPPPLLTDRVDRGDLGVKSGRGFYTYPDPAFAQPGFLFAGEEDGT